MKHRTPDSIPRPQYRCKNGLAAGTATSNGGILYELVPIWGSSYVRVRIKTATNGGTLDAILVGPDFDLEQSVAFASLVGTQYTTGNPTQVAVTAGTEAKLDLDLNTNVRGEEYVLLKFTGTVGAGTITYVDVAQI